MASNVANSKVVYSETRGHPYYNDFDEAKNFHQMVFRPGYAVQARELTQLQTILQAQIERFGNHIFKNGSIVAGGAITIGPAKHINLNPTYVGVDIDPADFDNKYVRWTANTKARAIVLDTVDATDTEPAALIVKYVSGQEFGAGDTIKVSDEETYANIAATGPFGPATVAYINDGIFFINGYFVKAPKQIAVIDKYTRQANVKVGLEFSPSIIDQDSDATLLDPAQETSNYQAPGATRFVIDLNLTTRSLTSEDDDQFIELMRIENGVIKKHIKYTIYSDIADMLARQKYDESGSFTVDDFPISFKDHPTDDTKVKVVIGAGKAYVKGYEYESISTVELDVPRARDSSNVQNYDLACNYGNYFVGQNLTGVFDHTTWATADLHLVPYTQVNRSNTTVYNATKIGTARVRNIIYYGAANTSDPNTYQHKISLTDLRFTPLAVNANGAAGSTRTLSLFNRNNNTLSSVTDAYKGARLVIPVSGVDHVYTVTGYTMPTITVNKDWISTPTGSTTGNLTFDFADAESLVVSALTPGAPSERANVNISTLNKFPALANGDAFLSETQLDTMIFKFPQDYIEEGTMADRDYAYRKKFSATFTASSATISVDSATEAFTGNASGVGAATLLSDWLVVSSSGTVLRLESVVVDGSQSATLTVTDYTGDATVYAKVNLNAGDNTNPKRKTKIMPNTTHFVGGTSNGSFAVGNTNTTVYLVNGQATIQNPVRVPGVPMSIYTSDLSYVWKIVNLNGAAIPAAGTSLSGYTDVTSSYLYVTGQKDSFYDHGTIYLRPGYKAHKGPLIVCYAYWDHSQGATADGLGYFSVDSYPNANTTTGYGNIPVYYKADGSTIELRDTIDFRPRRQNATNASPNYTLQGLRIPEFNEAFEADYSYYLPRRDFLVMTTDLTNPFRVLNGISSLSPQEPRNAEENMVLYKMYFPAYTESYRAITTEFVDNKRYTMKDIGRLEQRIEHLEYYQTLSLLEKNAASMVILDQFGLERTKYGILVDNFTGHGIGDVLNPDYKCAVNKVTGALVPAKKRREVTLRQGSNTKMKITGSEATLKYTEVDFIVQPYATKFENVQPYALTDYIGEIVMNPPQHVWIDQRRAPRVIINTAGVNDDYVSQENGATVGQNVGSPEDQSDIDTYENSTSVELTNFGTAIERDDENVLEPKSTTEISRTV